MPSSRTLIPVPEADLAQVRAMQETERELLGKLEIHRAQFRWVCAMLLERANLQRQLAGEPPLNGSVSLNVQVGFLVEDDKGEP